MLDGVARRIGDAGHADGPRYLGKLVILRHRSFIIYLFFVAYIYTCNPRFH